MSDELMSNGAGVTSNGVDPLAELVGDGKKFKTVVDLAKGKLESDAWIKKIEDENKALRILLENRKDKEQLEETNVTENTTASSTPPNTATTEARNQTEQFVRASDLPAMLEAHQRAEREKENLNSALGKVKGKFGDKTEDTIKERATTLGLEVNDLLAVARRSPRAFLNMIGEGEVAPQPTPLPKGLNSEAIVQFQSKSGDTRNKAFYDNLRKQMGATKFMMDSALQVQIHKDMQRLGDAWDA